MPKWLVEALKNNPLTEEDKDSIINSVLFTGKEHREQTKGMRPTEKDKQVCYNMQEVDMDSESCGMSPFYFEELWD